MQRNKRKNVRGTNKPCAEGDYVDRIGRTLDGSLHQNSHKERRPGSLTHIIRDNKRQSLLIVAKCVRRE